MFSSTLLLAAATLCGLVGAQNYSTSGPLSIDPNSVSMDTRMAWCRGQTNNCPLICGGQASPNTCNPVSNTPKPSRHEHCTALPTQPTPSQHR